MNYKKQNIEMLYRDAVYSHLLGKGYSVRQVEIVIEKIFS